MLMEDAAQVVVYFTFLWLSFNRGMGWLEDVEPSGMSFCVRSRL